MPLDTTERSPFKWQEALAFVLAVAGMFLDNLVAVGLCVLVAAIFACWGVWSHQRGKWLVKILSCIAIIQVFVVIFFVVRHSYIERVASRYEGILVAGDDETPHTTCPAAKDAVAIFLGNRVFAASTSTKITLISFRGFPLLVVEPRVIDLGLVKYSYLTISTLRLYDETGRSVVNITDNEYWISPLLRRERLKTLRGWIPGNNSLKIYGYDGRELMSLTYLNNKALKLTGDFRSDSGGLIAQVKDDYLLANRMMMRDVCLNETGGLLDVR